MDDDVESDSEVVESGIRSCVFELQDSCLMADYASKQKKKIDMSSLKNFNIQRRCEKPNSYDRDGAYVAPQYKIVGCEGTTKFTDLAKSIGNLKISNK